MQQRLAVFTSIAVLLCLTLGRWVAISLTRQAYGKREALLQLNLLIV